MKTCQKCKLDKHPDSFYANKRTKDGRRPYCKQCEAEMRLQSAEYTRAYNKGYFAGHKPDLVARAKANADSHPEQTREYQATYRARRRVDHPELDILTRCRTRARRLQVPFNLVVEDISIPEVCPVLGLPLVRRADGKKGGLPGSPSIDRIDPSRGYVRGNVRIISNRANTLKNDASVEELEKVLLDIRRIQGVAQTA